MNFIIEANTFIKWVTLPVYIATKDVIKEHASTGMIKLSLYPKILEIEAYNGNASITVKFNQSEGYHYNGAGQVIVRAHELINALKSFPASENLTVSIKDHKLKLSQVLDIYDYTKMTIFTDQVQYPLPPEVYTQEAIVDRDYFVNGLKQIKYATAPDKLMHCYFCALFESNNNTLKFTAGSGARFAVVEYVGNDRFISSGKIRIIIPKRNIANIIRVFEKGASPTLNIKISSKSATENIPQQCVIEADNVILNVYGLEKFTWYPDTNKTAAYSMPFQIPTDIQDWKYATEALIASRYSRTEDVHNVKVMADIRQGLINLQANTFMKINKKIPFEPDKCVIETGKEKEYLPWFCCNAFYFIEMVKMNKKKKTVIVNFEDQSRLDENHYLHPKPMGIVLLRFPDEIDNNGVMEKSLVFFANSTKWDDKYLSRECEAIKSRYQILDL